jgi:hypothetical protein
MNLHALRALDWSGVWNQDVPRGDDQSKPKAIGGAQSRLADLRLEIDNQVIGSLRVARRGMRPTLTKCSRAPHHTDIDTFDSLIGVNVEYSSLYMKCLDSRGLD